jgi:hypothetical protein
MLTLACLLTDSLCDLLCCVLSSAVNPSQERAHGAGLLVAESVLGPEHSLHSKAAAVLTLLLQEDLLSPEDFGAAAAADKAAAAAAETAAKAPKGKP